MNPLSVPATPVPAAPQVDLLGLRISRVNRAQTMAILRGFLADGRPHLVVTVDSSAVVIAARDPEYRAIVNAADLVTPDGAGILWAAKRLGKPLPERVSGVDLAEALCAAAACAGFSVFFYGGQPGIGAEAARRMRARYPGLRVAGTAHGYLTPEEQERLVAQIRAARPGVLLVARGIPYQEKWLARHLHQLGVPICMGVGGTLDVFSGRVHRAPRWMQRRGLEWLYRLLRDPRKIRKVAALPRFTWMVLRTRGG
ncbi:MAG: WecB/TagA/CpsF family glycosyltransferase [Armatimonadetes bacterium]|nr:WecB/TagA/CpsF family glycosyltransferase [Armatimonadota bacterium]